LKDNTASQQYSKLPQSERYDNKNEKSNELLSSVEKFESNFFIAKLGLSTILESNKINKEEVIEKMSEL